MALKKQAISFGGACATPATPTAAAGGSTGSTAYVYKIVAVLTDGTHSAVSAGGTASDGKATLDETNFNTVSWTDPVVGHGAVIDHIDVYRTSSAGTPSTTGKIGVADAGDETFDDTGLAGDASTAPSTNTTGVGTAVDAMHLTTMKFDISGVGSATYTGKVSYDNGTSWATHGTPLTAAGSIALPNAATQVRVDISSYVSGTAKGGFVGGSN